MSEKLTLVPAKKSAPTAIEPAVEPPNVFAWSDRFVQRHIGPGEDEAGHLLKACGFKSLDALIDAAVPSQIRLRKPLNLPPARSEHGLLGELKTIASQNQVFW